MAPKLAGIVPESPLARLAGLGALAPVAVRVGPRGADRGGVSAIPSGPETPGVN